MSSKNNSKYVPVHLRNKKQPEKVSLDPEPPTTQKSYEQEFPALGSKLPATARVWGGTESFAEKAREWSNSDKLKQQEEEERRKDEEIFNRSMHRNLPKFNNPGRFVEQEVYEEETQHDTTNQKQKEDDEGWTLVENTRKIKKRKTVEEIVREKMAKTSDSEGENDDTVWNEEKQPNETYWDQRY